MNANELADIQAFETDELTMWIRHETATMLRQQQAEIEALKAKTLTDEDLEQLVTDMPTEPSENELYEFAYNVLRKAQEK